jgi:hypothetical protein
VGIKNWSKVNLIEINKIVPAAYSLVGKCISGNCQTDFGLIDTLFGIIATMNYNILQ